MHNIYDWWTTHSKNAFAETNQPWGLHREPESDKSVSKHGHTQIWQILEVFATSFSVSIAATTMQEDMKVYKESHTPIPPTIDKQL